MTSLIIIGAVVAVLAVFLLYRVFKPGYRGAVGVRTTTAVGKAPARRMRSGPTDYGRTAAVAFLAVVVPVGIGLIIYWTVRTSFPEITLGGWLLVWGYLLTTAAVPTALTRAIDLERYTWGRAWRVTAFVWVTVTAIIGLLVWPAIGPYIKPFFVGSGNAL